MPRQKILGYPALGSLRGGTEHEKPSKLEIRKKYEKTTKSPISGGALKMRQNTEKLQKQLENDRFP